MSEINNQITDLIDEMHKLRSGTLHIACQGAVPFYADLPQKDMVQMSRKGSIPTEEILEDMEALGFTVTDGFELDFVHCSENGEGSQWRMSVLVRKIGITDYITFTRHGMA
jgi:hypothetical protein